MFNHKKNIFFRLILTTLIVSMSLFFAGCASDGDQQQGGSEDKPTLVFADAGWDSIQFHNSVAQIIIENGYGYPTDTMVGSTPITFEGLAKGDIQIYIEVWTSNIQKSYDTAIENGDVIELGINFDDNMQGLYVPTYMIKGDPERGIEPMAPDLKTMNDLPKYWELFKDPEDPSKGRIYGAIAGWAADTILYEKMKNYGLDEYYNYMNPGSDTALATSMLKAYENGDPWLGYYWEPTWVMGLLDMTLIEDTPYSDELWNDGYRCAFPSVPCTVAVYKDLPEMAPEVVDFLKNYKTSSEITNKALAYMQKNEASAMEAAKWFLQEYKDLWTTWVPEEVANKVLESI